nr:MAG TPA: hypothetical protein [Caudoviricetes sp.]
MLPISPYKIICYKEKADLRICFCCAYMKILYKTCEYIF